MTRRAPSSQALFRATKPRRQAGPALPVPGGLPEQRRPDDARRADDFYPTGQPEAIRALLSRDGDLIRKIGGKAWEPAVGDGALAREMQDFGMGVVGSDIVDRGWPGVCVRSFYDYIVAPAPIIITNPPFCEINARDGHGRWLRHTLDMPGWRYLALLLSWDWPAARANGLGAMLDATPFSWCYLMRWKLDFTGAGSPPQRNAWFVWSRDDARGYGAGMNEPSFRFLDRTDDWRQRGLL